jgi:OOP family OmpA-OmpF porin
MTRLASLACAIAFAGLALPATVRAQTNVCQAAGGSKFEIDCSGATSCDKTSGAYKLVAGVQANDNLAFEMAYHVQGASRFSGVDPSAGNVSGEYRGRGIGLFGVVVAPYGRRAGLFGKLGIVNTRVELKAQSASGEASRAERHTNVAWGVGAGYDLTDSISTRLEFERARVKFLGARNDVDMVTLAVLYRF